MPADGGPLGSRFVRPHGAPAIYASLAERTAYREMNQDFYRALAGPGAERLAGRSGLRPEPMTVFGADVSVSVVLDLRGESVRAHFGTSAPELTVARRRVPAAPTQELGHAVEAGGVYEGMLYRSARDPEGACLVLFPRRFRTGSVVDIRDPSGVLSGGLPRTPG